MKQLFIPLALVLLIGCSGDALTNVENLESSEHEMALAKGGGGSALEFDGTDDYVRVSDDESLDLTALTISAWVYLDAHVDWASVVTKGGFDGDGPGALTANNYTLHQFGMRLRFTNDFGIGGDSNTDIPLNEWHHVAVTHDGSTLRFYLDGAIDGEHAVLGPGAANNLPLHIGVDFPGGDEYWDGRIDEVKVWNVALTPAQVRASMRGHATPLASALVGYWRFDEGAGTTAADRSGTGNDGTLINGPTWISPGAPVSERP